MVEWGYDESAGTCRHCGVRDDLAHRLGLCAAFAEGHEKVTPPPPRRQQSEQGSEDNIGPFCPRVPSVPVRPSVALPATPAKMIVRAFVGDEP
eukprot:6114563-Pyramimonas_sp.AAC.1